MASRKFLAAVCSVTLSLSLASLALAQSTEQPSQCGPAQVYFDVKTSHPTQTPPAKPDAGKALIYFLQDDSSFPLRPRPTTRFVVDGAWIGATHANSYFFVSVDPGVHHLCAEWQSYGFGRKAAAAHFVAEPGGVYYMVAENTGTRGFVKLSFGPADSDEALLLMKDFSLSTSHSKKQ